MSENKHPKIFSVPTENSLTTSDHSLKNSARNNSQEENFEIEFNLNFGDLGDIGDFFTDDFPISPFKKELEIANATK